jgi:glycoside/pentoside/hexuronide:cation symporter, GPH family
VTTANNEAAKAASLSHLQLFGYSLGSLGTGIFSTVPSVLLLFFMTDVLGVSAALAALAVSLPKLLDIVVDPLVGSLSDRTRSRWGRRRPYLLVGALSMGATFFMLFAVPPFAEPISSFWYVTIVFTVSAAAYSVFAVPYIAMPAEMSPDPHTRTVIVSWRMAFALAGILIGSAGVPALVAALGGGRAGFAAMSAIIGAFCLAVMLATFFATRSIPSGERSDTVVPLSAQLRLMLANKPFFVLLIVYVVQLTGLGAFSAVVPYLTIYVLGRDDAFVGLIFLCLVGSAVVSSALWSLPARYLGKRRAYAVAVLLYAAANLGLLSVSAQNINLLFPLAALMGAGFGGMQVLPFAMVTDTIQLDAQRSGLRREGLFTGLWTAGEKAGLAFGPLVAGLMLSAFGFVESTGTRVAQPESALIGITIIACIVPSMLLLSSLIFLRAYTLTEQQLVAKHPAVNAAGS